MSATPSLIERRDARQVLEIARQLVVSAETVPCNDGRYFTAVPAWFLLELLNLPGNGPGDEVFVVIDAAHVRRMKQPAGLRSIEQELRAVRDAESNRRALTEERAANLAARQARQVAAPRATTDAAPPAAPPIVEEIRATRAILGLTLDQLAAAIGVSKWTVRKWSRGALAPSPERLAAMRRLVAAQKGAARG